MNLRQLEYFRKLFEKEHMTAAAEELNTTQPNLSHAMRELEKELNVQLFEKSGRNIRMTRYGKLFYPHVVKTLDALENGKTILQNNIDPSKGTIHLGYVNSLGPTVLPELLHDFREIPGNNQLTFNLVQGYSYDLYTQLEQNDIDFVIGSKLSEFPNITYEPFMKQQMVLVVPLDHPLAKKDSVDLRETVGEPYVVFNKENGARGFIDNLFESLHISRDIVYEVAEDHALAGFVSFGHGIAVTPDIPVLKKYPLKVLKIKNNPPRYLYFSTIEGRFLSPVSQRFAEFIRTYDKVQQ